MILMVLVLLYFLLNSIYARGTAWELEYKETAYPIVNISEDNISLKKVSNLYNKADCAGLLELYRKLSKDKVIRMKLVRKEAYYYARYIGIKWLIYNRMVDLYNKGQCEKVFSDNFSMINLRNKVIEYIEMGRLAETRALINKHNLPELNKWVDILKISKSKYIEKEVIQSHYEHNGKIPIERCFQKVSYLSRYPQTRFFTRLPDSVVFFDGGNMYIYDTNEDLNEVLNLYDSIKPQSMAQNYLDLKNILGLEQSGYSIYITVFSGDFFVGRTLERLGINISLEHIFKVPLYKVLAFDTYSKKVVWESVGSNNFSYLSPPTYVGNNLYIMCGEFSERELTNYLCKLDINSGRLLDKIYISTDKIDAVAREKNTMFYIEYAKPHAQNTSLYMLLYSGGILVKYDFNRDLIVFILRFRRNDILPLPLRFYGDQIWVGTKRIVFFNSNHYNFFIVDKVRGRVVNAVSRGVSGNLVKRCYALEEQYVCIFRDKIFVFDDDGIRVINFRLDDIFIDRNQIFIVRNKKIYFAKNLFFSKIFLIFKLGQDVEVEELHWTSKYLFIKGKKSGNCIVNIFEKK